MSTQRQIESSMIFRDGSTLAEVKTFLQAEGFMVVPDREDRIAALNGSRPVGERRQPARSTPRTDVIKMAQAMLGWTIIVHATDERLDFMSLVKKHFPGATPDEICEAMEKARGAFQFMRGASAVGQLMIGDPADEPTEMGWTQATQSKIEALIGEDGDHEMVWKIARTIDEDGIDPDDRSAVEAGVASLHGYFAAYDVIASEDWPKLIDAAIIGVTDPAFMRSRQAILGT